MPITTLGKGVRPAGFDTHGTLFDRLEGENIDFARKNDSQPRYRKATVDEFRKSMKKRARIRFRHL